MTEKQRGLFVDTGAFYGLTNEEIEIVEEAVGE